ncbi:Putative tyrosinase-like protein tyr [Seminavis robusta]|uniref:Tyrosinase-like protein tyr n=1 Tax=Seminavis robusta TaxID=568900 RepID=A0A9N8D4W9_9STRA|nr:Putative tyrosinase-like protein tyr [Seminavis robusta]|eukprot:Sro6_g004880.1 Putative tyrosinase-like protein tyr (506) ;mRNA; f:39274-41106
MFAKVALLVLSLLQLGVVDAQNCGVSRRRPWRSLSCQEQQAYIDAVVLMKNSGIYDEITRVHQNSGNDNHFVPPFLPFHRWLIWIFEREMQRMTGTCITVPYWDWERGSRGQAVAPILMPWSFGSNNGGGCTTDGITRNWRVAENGGCLIRRFQNQIGLIRDVEILNRIVNQPTHAQFWPSYEAAPHTNPHDYIGGPMEGFWAPDDPIFHLHHSNVDRHFALWQNFHNHDGVPVGQLGGQHYSANIDAPMRIRQGPRVSFNAPGTNRPPTIREVMMIRGGIINVQYVDDELALMLQRTDPRFDNNPGWHVPGTVPTRGCSANGGGGNPPQGGGGGGNPPQGGGGGGNPPQGGGGGGNPPQGGGQQPQCQRVGQRCQRNRHCCSGQCRRSTGRCRRRRNGERRALEEGLEAPHFSSPWLEDRWTELMSMEEYRNNSGRIWQVLGREDCERRAAIAAANNDNLIDGPSPLSVVKHHANVTSYYVTRDNIYVDGNLTTMFDCHHAIDI